MNSKYSIAFRLEARGFLSEGDLLNFVPLEVTSGTITTIPAACCSAYRYLSDVSVRLHLSHVGLVIAISFP